MALAKTCRIIFGTLFSLHLLASPGIAQNCYYPNGKLSTVDAPCSSDGGMCCAVGWECLSNGLCYLEAEDYTERRSCTDQSWGDECSQFCVTGASVIGNEAIQQCADGHWCCDADRHQNSPYCCDSTNASLVIDVPDGSQYAFISSLSSPSSAAPASRSTRQSSTTSDSSSDRTSSPPSTSQTPTPTPTPTTITRLDTTSNSNGQAITITSLITSVPSPTSTSAIPPAVSSASSGPKTLTIIVAVIVPVVVLSLLGLAYFLYRRHQRNRPAQLALAPPEMVNMYRDPDDTPELNGDFPTTGAGGASTSDNKAERKSELYGSTPGGGGGGEGGGGYAIHQHSPAVSSLTTNPNSTNRNSAATDPPLYSPVSGIQQTSPALGAGNAGTTPMLPQVQEEQAYELWGGDWPGRMMYAPSPPPQVLQPGYTAYQPSLPAEDVPKGSQGGGQAGEAGVGRGEQGGQAGEGGEVRPKDY